MAIDARRSVASGRVRLGVWLWLLTMAGYPIAGLLATLLNLESTLASVPFRAVVLVLSLLALSRMPRATTCWFQQRWLLLFWFIYVLRLAWDAGAVGVAGSAEALWIFVFIILLPSIAAALCLDGSFPERLATERLALLSAGACAFAIAMQSLGLGSAQTLDPYFTGGRLSFVAVNPITLGHTAATALICVLCLSRHSRSAQQWAALLLCAVVAGLCLVAAGSRGPIVSLVVCGAAYAMGSRQYRLVAIMALALTPAVLNPDNDLARRIETAAGDDASTLERLLIQANAIEQFLGSPLVGSAFVETVSETYPHNMFIEIVMALGLVGLICAIPMLVNVVRAGWVMLQGGRPLLPLLFIQFFTAAQFSGALWSLTSFWACVALMGRPSARRASSGARPRFRPALSSAPVQAVAKP